MYVRKKHNRSGTTSVVVVSKASGKYKEIKSFGASSSEEDIESLCNKAAAWIRSFGGQQELDFNNRRGKEVEDTKRLLNNIDNILINGTQLLLGDVSALIGFPQSCDASGTIVGILLCSFFGTADNKAFAIGPLEFMADIVPFVQ
jgi:hypothetical protein